MSPSRNDRIDYQSLAEFRYQLRRYLHFSETAARESGLEPQQHQLLLALKGLPAGQEPSVSTLAERLQIQHQSAVGLVDRSEERGLVSRHRSADDRRTVRVALTEEGARILESLSRAHHAELTSAAPALIRSLNRLLADMPEAVADRAKRGEES